MRPVGWRRARRRIEVISLRWHARLDSDWADHTLPWLLASALFLLLAGLSFARNRMLVHGLDLADYTQAAWKLRDGRDPVLTLRGYRLLELHGSLAFYGVAQLTRVLPIASTLLALQAMALAYGVLPLWRLARRTVLLRVGAATALVVAYGLHPVLQNLNLADFHPEALAVPALLAMCQRGVSGSRFRFAAAAALAVACRADLALLVAGFGGLLAFGGRRRAGVATVLAGLVWWGLSLRVGWLGAGDGGAPHPGAYAEVGEGLWGVLGELVTHPFDAVARLVRRENFDFALELLLPVAFLPLLSARWLLAATPWALSVLLADVPTDVRATVLAAPLLPFVVAGAAAGMGRLGRPTLERVTVSPRVVGALLLASVTFTIAWSAASPYEEPWAWGGRDASDGNRLRAVDAIDDDASVLASEGLVALVAGRDQLGLLRSSEDVVDGVDALFFEVEDLPRDDELIGGAPDGFVSFPSDEGIVLYLRDRSLDAG